MDQTLRKQLQLFANDIRRESIKEIAALGVGHVGGTMSLADVLAVLYGAVLNYKADDPNWDMRDHFVLSKGHGGPALYATLALKGFFPMEWLKTLNKPGTNLPSHVDRAKTPGIDATTGSLGQGLAVACGLAVGKQMNRNETYVYTVLGDGECNEGEIWEAALLAAHRKLDHLIAFVDYNHQVVDGTTEEICDLGDLREKFEAFNWHAQDVNGHDIEAIYEAIAEAKKVDGKPHMIILQTVKAKGLSRLEGQPTNHNCNVSMDELEIYLRDLEDQRKQIV